MADNFSDIKLDAVDRFLNTYSRRLKKVLDENPDVTFSRFEILLPIILDQFAVLKNNIKIFRSDRHKEAFDNIVIWLTNEGYLDNQERVVDDKDITIEDMINFAACYCTAIRFLISSSSGDSREDRSGYNSLNTNFFKEDKKIPKKSDEDDIPDSMSFNQVIYNLSKDGKLYSNNTDIILRKLAEERKFNITDKKYITYEDNKSNVRRKTLGEYTHFEITDKWNKLINKAQIVNKLKSIPELQNANWVNNENIDANDFYESLKVCYENNIGNLKKDSQIESVVKNCDPAALLFLLQKVEDTVTKKYSSKQSVDGKVLADKLVLIRENLKKMTDIIKIFNLPSKKNADNIFDYRDGKYIIPKSIEPINTEAYKVLLSTLNVKNDILEQLDNKVSVLNDIEQLYSLYANFNNDDTVNHIIEFITRALVQQKLSEPPYNFKSEIKNGELLFSTDNRNYIEEYKDKFNDILREFMTYLDLYKKVVYQIKSGTFNIDSTLGADVTASNTQLYVRGYAATYINKLYELSRYSQYKKYNLDDINYDAIINSNFAKYFILNANLLLTSALIPINSDFEDLIKTISFEKYPTLGELDEIYNVSKEEATRKVNSLLDSIREKLAIKQTSPVQSPKHMNTYLNKFSSFLKNLEFKRQASYKFTEDDLVDFFKSIYKFDESGKRTLLSNKKQTLLSSIYDVESAAVNIINFLNLKSSKDLSLGSCINQLIQLSKNPEYSNIFINIFDINFIQENSVAIIDAIYDILNLKNTNLDYNSILNDILSLNINLTGNKNLAAIATSDQEKNYVKFIQDNNINTFISTNLNMAGLNIDLSNLIVFIARVLFKTYIDNIKRLNNKTLLNYVINQKFNLLIDVCNSLSINKNSFTDRILDTIKLINDKDYLLNAENKYNSLVSQSSYRDISPRVIQMISNYKVLSNIRGLLFNVIKSDSLLDKLMDGCTDWDFSDDLINAVLKYANIYNVSGQLVSGDIKDLKSNITRPFDYKYEMNDSFETKITRISNKLKNLNSVSVNRNIIALLKIVKLVEPEIRSIEHTANKISLAIVNNPDVLKDDQDNLNESLIELYSSINEIVRKAKDSIIDLKPGLEKIITDWTSKHPELDKYITIKTKFDRHMRDVFTKDFNILPVDIIIDAAAIENSFRNNSVFQEISGLDSELRSMKSLISQYIYNAIIKSDVTSDILSGLDTLNKDVNRLLSELTSNVEKKFNKKFITVSYVNQEVNFLKIKLSNFILNMCKETNECIELTQNVEKDVKTLWLIMENISEKYNIEL